MRRREEFIRVGYDAEELRIAVWVPPGHICGL